MRSLGLVVCIFATFCAGELAPPQWRATSSCTHTLLSAQHHLIVPTVSKFSFRKHNTATAAFPPQSIEELKSAVAICLKASPLGDCVTGPHEHVGKWDISRLTDMTGMFDGASSFNADISTWNVSSVISMRKMFYGATSFNANISRWDVSRVTDMQSMFNKASSFNADISNWDVSLVATMCKMFANATSFKRKLSGIAWTQSTANKDDMFKGSAGYISSIESTFKGSAGSILSIDGTINSTTVSVPDKLIAIPFGFIVVVTIALIGLGFFVVLMVKSSRAGQCPLSYLAGHR